MLKTAQPLLLAAVAAAQLFAPPLRAVAKVATPATAVAAAQPAAPAPDPRAVIRGWSFGSELDGPIGGQKVDVDLEPGHSDLVLFFGSAGKTSEFRYRLDGYDADWTETRGTTAHYRRLPPEHYLFQVQVKSAGGEWLEPRAEISVTQQPFFYQTWYAYLLVGIGVLFIGAQLLRQRDQLLKGQMGVVLEERNRIASECHDTLMAGFAAVSWQLEATANLLHDSEKRESPATQSFELARSMVAHCQAEARRIIWDLRNSDRITNVLSEALGDAISAHRLRDSANVSMEVHGDEIPISPGAVHHLVCIGQEAVSNAIRHAKSSRVMVRLRYDSDSLSLVVKDDGCGFQHSDRAIHSGHFGIPVMEERARKLGGAFRLTSTANTGTEVAVSVSFQRIHLAPVQDTAVVPWIGI